MARHARFAEIFLRDDIARDLAPLGRYLDIRQIEHPRAVGIADLARRLPEFDGRIRVLARPSESPLDPHRFPQSLACLPLVLALRFWAIRATPAASTPDTRCRRRWISVNHVHGRWQQDFGGCNQYDIPLGHDRDSYSVPGYYIWLARQGPKRHHDQGNSDALDHGHLFFQDQHGGDDADHGLQ